MSGGLLLLMPGIALILFGILVLVMPEILVALVAGAFILSGITLLSWGLRVRRMGGGSFISVRQRRDPFRDDF